MRASLALSLAVAAKPLRVIAAPGIAAASTCTAGLPGCSGASGSLVRRVRVELVADVVCPWCYIGYARLHEAVQLASAAGIETELTYTPFILRRHLPREGTDKFAMFQQMFGSAAAVEQKYAGIDRAASLSSLCFDPIDQLAGNSEDAQRLLMWAQDMGASHGSQLLQPLLAELFARYNCQRQWVGDSGVLLRAAIAVGLPEEEAAMVIAQPRRYSEALEGGLARSEELGVSSVPVFVVHAVSAQPMLPVLLHGAVPAEELAAAMDAVSGPAG